MKNGLAAFYKQTRKFRGKVFFLGERGHVLLKNIEDVETGRYVTDHSWVPACAEDDKKFLKFYRSDTPLEFSAKVLAYRKDSGELDFKLKVHWYE